MAVYHRIVHFLAVAPIRTPRLRKTIAMKTILLSAAASIAMTGAALAGGGPAPSFTYTGVPTLFSSTIPTMDTGSQAYPSTQGVGAGAVRVIPPHFNPALLTQPDTGSQQPPPGLR